jgi:glycosyltransferase involved in cell wall biosynthesis
MERSEPIASVDSPIVSIIIPCYNAKETIGACLESLMRQESDICREIVVVDSSQDDTTELISRSFPQVIVIRSNERLLPGAARNTGAEIARGEILAFIDSDAVADRAWLGRIAESIRSGYRIMGGAVANLNPHCGIGIADFILSFNEFAPGMPRREVSCLPSVNLACTRELFRDIGGFLSGLPTGEDTLFTFAASRKTKILFDPCALVYHRNREGLSSFMRHQYVYGKNASLIRKRYALRGALLARIPLLAFAAPVLKAAIIGIRILHRNRRLLPDALRTLPWIVLGIHAWGYGFIEASFFPRHGREILPIDRP